MQTFHLKVLRECSSCASRNGALQMFFFLTPTRNKFVAKFVKWLRFLAVLLDYIFYNVEWVEVRKMSKVYWEKLCCKMNDLFCWLWDVLLEYLKWKDKFQIWGFESFIFWSKFCFFGTAFGRFSQWNLKIFPCQQTMVSDIFTSRKGFLRPCIYIWKNKFSSNKQ